MRGKGCGEIRAVARFPWLRCVFALAGVLVFGSFLPGDIGAAKRNPIYSKCPAWRAARVLDLGSGLWWVWFLGLMVWPDAES